MAAIGGTSMAGGLPGAFAGIIVPSGKLGGATTVGGVAGVVAGGVAAVGRVVGDATGVIVGVSMGDPGPVGCGGAVMIRGGGMACGCVSCAGKRGAVSNKAPTMAADFFIPSYFAKRPIFK